MKKTIKKIIKYLSITFVSSILLWVAFLFSINTFAYASDVVTIPNGKTVIFLDREEGFNYIVNNKLIDNFSKLDIELRLEKELPDKNLETCKKVYTEFLKTQILNWKGIDKRFVIKRLTKAYEMIEEVSPNVLQDTVYMILASGKQEFGGFYTLKNAIVCPCGKLRMSSVYMPFMGYLKRYFTRVMVHELFHIFSTNNPGKREKFYQVISFEKIDGIELSPEISSNLIYNPDDKQGFYKIRLTEKDSEIEKDYCMLILSKYPTWQGYIEFKGRISTLLVYVESCLHPIEYKDDKWISVCDENSKPVIKQKYDFNNFYKKTGYDSYSPEEIVAHLFIDVVLSKFDESVLKEKSDNYKNILLNLENVIKK